MPIAKVYSQIKRGKSLRKVKIKTTLGVHPRYHVDRQKGDKNFIFSQFQMSKAQMTFLHHNRRQLSSYQGNQGNTQVTGPREETSDQDAQ